MPSTALTPSLRRGFLSPADVDSQDTVAVRNESSGVSAVILLSSLLSGGDYNDLSNVPLDWNGSEYDAQADINMGSYSMLGSAISLDIQNGYILDTGGYTTVDVGSHTLNDSNGNSVCDFSMNSGDGVVIFNEDVEIESGTLHLYYLKDDPMNPASFIVDLSSGYFNLASGVLQVNGTAGANFGPGMPTSMTIVDGIVTAAS